jgi:transposase
MLIWENCVVAQALRTKGWSISAIANHLGHDRKTIRAYLNGERRPGERKPARTEEIAEFVEYCRWPLSDDPHLWSTTLFEEVVELGFSGSYQAFAAGVRRHELRPRCRACAAAKSKGRSVIDHPPGQETQWDCLELPDPRAPCGVVGRSAAAGWSGHAGHVVRLGHYRRRRGRCRRLRC